MTDFVLKNIFFKFNMEMKIQKSGTVIGTKFALPIFMDPAETKCLTVQDLPPFLWLHLMDNIFFIWTHAEEKLVQFLNKFNNFHLNLRFRYETLKNNVSRYF